MDNTKTVDMRRKKRIDMRRFIIGDMVWVEAIVDAFYDPADRRRIVRVQLEKPIGGQIVGLTRIQVGKYSPGGECPTGMESEPDFVPPYLDVKGQETVWLVRFGMLNKPVKVLDEDVKHAEYPGAPAVGFELPLMYQKKHNWPQKF